LVVVGNILRYSEPHSFRGVSAKMECTLTQKDR
jgi:hypothetical protein